MKACILGRHGFIGSALSKKFDEVTSYPSPDCDVIIHLASPTHMAFEKNPGYHMKSVLDDFMYLLPFCERNQIKFVYASSALVYEESKDHLAFTKCKKIMEMLASISTDTLGLRIFPVYGPGENVTVISKWAWDMNIGKAPVVYGDGTQERDFIFIDDAVDQIVTSILCGKTGVIDIGAGKPVSFNDIIKAINLVFDTDLEPVYVDAPQDYSKGLVCQNPLPTKIDLYHGIKRLLG